MDKMDKPHFSDCYRSYCGSRFFCRHLKPENDEDPKCLVFICHGLGEHIGRYNELYQKLTKQGIYVFGHDHYAHGRTNGYRIWVPSYDSFTEPIQAHIAETKALYPGKKIFIYGHSMGGLVAIRLAQAAPDLFDGLILEAPFLGLTELLSPWATSLAKFLGRQWLVGSLPVTMVDPKMICRDLAIVSSYENDPLVYHGWVNARFFTSSLEACQEAYDSAGKLTMPIFIGHGQLDQLCSLSGSKNFEKVVGSKDVQLIVYEEAYHQLRCETHENIKEVFFTDMHTWILSHC